MENNDFMKYTFLIVLIAMLGTNIFVYLARGTDLLAEILKLFTKETTNVSKKVVSTSAKGVKAGVNIAEKALTTSLEKIENVVEHGPHINLGGDLEQLLHAPNLSRNMNFIPDTSFTSRIQQRGKSGYCYIGNDRGFRSCVEVGANDVCMSNQIFPTRDICIHPNLRP